MVAVSMGEGIVADSDAGRREERGRRARDLLHRALFTQAG